MIKNQIDMFLARMNERMEEHYRKDLPNVDPEKVEAEYGTKYCRIVRISNSGGRSAFCFISLKDGEYKAGDILKAASWKIPAKGARGNIFESLDRGVGVYGANYKR